MVKLEIKTNDGAIAVGNEAFRPYVREGAPTEFASEAEAQAFVRTELPELRKGILPKHWPQFRIVPG